MGHPAWYASRVSIPFIAGQWSLPVAWEEETWLLAPQFQSPSLRGSGRFTTTRRARARARWGVSIPFIAGQWSLPLRIHRIIPVSRAVSIPFIAGQWSLLGPGVNFMFLLIVSIPFIAGQWSLRQAIGCYKV